jgi:hypothetical protein
VATATLAMEAAPAHTTVGLICRTAGIRPIEVSLVIGHTVISSVVSARLRDAGADVPVRVGQSWLDSRELRLDLTDPRAVRHELRLRTVRKDLTFDGVLWRGGMRRWVRCREN